MLEVRQLNVWYGAAQALFDVSLTVGAGELVVLQGLNGAGKSTLLQASMGLSQRQTGAISYQNETISGWPPYRRALAGLGYVAEDRRLFGALTVRENLHIAARGDVPANEARVLDLFPALKVMLQRRASQMSGGEQQMLAVARGIMADPIVLMIDELSLGLAPVLTLDLFQALRKLRNEGITILLVEQNVRMALKVSDYAYVLNEGRIDLHGPSKQIEENESVREAYLGI